MSNSSLATYVKISPNKNVGRTDKNKVTWAIDRITPHCVVGQLSVESIGSIFLNKNNQASSNYGIGKDGKIGMYVEEKDRSWCSSSAANDYRAVTIECASDKTEPYAFNNEVYESLIKLCVDICRRNGKTKLIWISDKAKALAYTPNADEMLLTVHRWFANKSCPGNWLFSRLGDVASRVTAELNPVATIEIPTTSESHIKNEDVSESFAEFKKNWLQLRKELQDNDCSKWSAEARQWAINFGLIAGGTPLPNGQPNYMWEDLLTREQAVTLFYRFYNLMINTLGKK